MDTTAPKPPEEPSRPARSRAAALLSLLSGAFLAAPPLAAQEPAAADSIRNLSLAEAVRLAEEGSEQVRIAEASVQRARGMQRRALAARLPRLDASVSYTRTLDSQFRNAFPDSAGGFGGADFGSLGFGSENTYNLGLNVSWRLFDGGALGASSRSAQAGHRAARIALASARASLTLEVTQAYFDAQLAQRMAEIAEASLQQAEDVLHQATQELQEGNQSEFEVLRARVERDNRKPTVIRRRAARDVAYFRLAQLLDLPLDEPLVLTDDLEAISPADTATASVAAAHHGDRAVVRQAEATLSSAEGQADQARAERFPGVSLTSAYGRVAYPRDATPRWSQFRTNWTVGVALDLPIFDGGRISADEATADAGLAEAEARLESTRERAALDSYQARAELDAAKAAWDASSGTVAQAQRAYDIAALRYREGLSSQLELSDARLLLEQARGNRAQAARDLRVAATRVRLLPDLPLGTVGGSAGVAGATSSAGAPGTGGTTGMSAGSGPAAGSTNPSAAGSPTGTSPGRSNR